MPDLPETVTLPVDAVIEAAATFFAYGLLACIVGGRTDNEISEVPWGPAHALLRAAGLATHETVIGTVPAQGVQERLDAREAAITAELLGQISAAARLEREYELSRVAVS